MSKHLRAVLFAALALSLLAALPVIAQAKTTFTTSKPVLSGTSTMGKDFSVSGVITPASTAKSRATVKVRLLREMDGKYDVMDVYTAKLAKMPAGKKGTKYSRTLNIPVTGKHAVQAFQYRGGKLVSKSQITYFDVQMAVQQVTIDSMVNGWMAPSLGVTMAPADTPLDIVFTTPSDWASDDPAKHYGAAHFMWGDFEKVGVDGLTWHTDGLRPGRYDWMRDAMPKWGTGSLVVAQQHRHRQDLTRRHSRAAVPAGRHLLRRRQLRGHGLRPQHRVPHARLRADEPRPARVAHRRPGPRTLRLEVLDGRLPPRDPGRRWSCPAGADRFGPPGLGDGGDRHARRSTWSSPARG